MAGAGRVQYNRINEVSLATANAIKQVILATAGNIVEVAAASMEGQEPPSPPGHAPAIRSGILHGGMKVDDDNMQTSSIVTAYTDVEYAQHLEFGTIRMEARPFLRPAAEQVRGPFEQAVRAAIRRIR